jgi:ribonuclease-3
VIAHALYQHLPHAKEGDLSRYRAKLVCEEMLATIALEFDLGSFLLLGVGELKSGGFRRKSTIADALEALIAAIYLDSDLITCQKLVEQWFAQRLLEVTQSKLKKDSKSMLQEYLQSQKLALPYYKVLKISGKNHEQVFHMLCRIESIQEEAVGQGCSRRIAEQEAAAALLEKIFTEGKK